MTCFDSRIVRGVYELDRLRRIYILPELAIQHTKHLRLYLLLCQLILTLYLMVSIANSS